MKTSIFIANAISAIFVIYFTAVDPSITGFVIAEKPQLDLASPLGFAVIFIVTTIALDVYFYIRSKNRI
ncbi:MAG: hypothetical protein U9O94_02990 [Nanoarchaeota archaeon]|nr:hypothetical protein [Nanoarchaeota archaeon]